MYILVIYIIKVFYFYQKTLNPRSRLFLVGSHSGQEKYLSYLRALVRELDLRDVVFTGHVNQKKLLAYYRIADAFLCMSEHEGFLIPVLESMHFGIPVIAYDAGAVRGTLGGASILVTEKKFEEIAELVGLVIEDADLREKIVECQTRRLADFQRPVVEKRLREYLAPFLD